MSKNKDQNSFLNVNGKKSDTGSGGSRKGSFCQPKSPRVMNPDDITSEFQKLQSKNT